MVRQSEATYFLQGLPRLLSQVSRQATQNQGDLNSIKLKQNDFTMRTTQNLQPGPPHFPCGQSCWLPLEKVSVKACWFCKMLQYCNILFSILNQSGQLLINEKDSNIFTGLNVFFKALNFCFCQWYLRGLIFSGGGGGIYKIFILRVPVSKEGKQSTQIQHGTRLQVDGLEYNVNFTHKNILYPKILDQVNKLE